MSSNLLIAVSLGCTFLVGACGAKNPKQSKRSDCSTSESSDSELRLADSKSAKTATAGDAKKTQSAKAAAEKVEDEVVATCAEKASGLLEAEEYVPMGKINKDTKSTLKLKAKSAYAIVTEGEAKAFSLSLTEVETDEETLTKDIKSYSCEDCEDEDDPRCKSGAKPNILTISFSQSAVTSKGMPTNTSYKLEGDPVKDLEVGVVAVYSGAKDPSQLAPKGTFKFKKKPTKVPSDVSADLNLEMMVDGKKKTIIAKVETKLIKLGKRPSAKKTPTCEEGQYLKPLFAK